MRTRRCKTYWLLAASCLSIAGCATIKESDTARTGVEQLLISSAADKALDKIDFRPIANAKVYVEEKYLDCVDKNYVLVALHQHLLKQNCTLADKADDADVVLEIGSGGVGTDRNELFVGTPQIPLPPPSPISVPKMAFYSRIRAIGTAKLSVVAYDAKSKHAVIHSGYTLARSDYKNWTLVGTSGMYGGSVETELVAATGENESMITVPTSVASRQQSAAH